MVSQQMPSVFIVYFEFSYIDFDLIPMESIQLEVNSKTWSSISITTVDDPSSTYFLHHFDSLWLVSVPQQLTGENYAVWSFAMTIALLVKNKLSFTDGSMG